MMKLCEFNENKERNSYLRRPSSDWKIRVYTQCRAGPIRSAASGKSQLPSTDSLCKICLGNMISVWNFLIARVKSEKTVENIRRNITVHGGGSGGDSGDGGKEEGRSRGRRKEKAAVAAEGLGVVEWREAAWRGGRQRGEGRKNERIKKMVF
jgi:hypothetical protein